MEDLRGFENLGGPSETGERTLICLSRRITYALRIKVHYESDLYLYLDGRVGWLRLAVESQRCTFTAEPLSWHDHSSTNCLPWNKCCNCGYNNFDAKSPHPYHNYFGLDKLAPS